MLNAIYKFFGMILSFFSNITGGYYLFGLFIFALLIKLLLLPLSIKQQKNSIKQAKLRPKEMAIRRKYKGRTDQKTQREMQEEIAALYASENYNPMSGCGPLLLQMPIIIILYNVIINPLKYICGWSADQIKVIADSLGLAEKASEFASRDIGLIQYFNSMASNEVNFALTSANLSSESLANIPNFTLGAFDLSMNPGWNLLIIVPILTFVFQFLASKITRKFTFQPMQGDQATNSTMKVMDIALPALTTWIAFGVPAAIGIYWMFNNILGTIQTIVLHKFMPLPSCTEEDIKAAERELKGKAPKRKNLAAEETRSPRSLHYIDFDDEEEIADLGEYESIYDKSPEEKEKAAEEKEEISESKKKLFGKADMKDDK